MQTKSEFHRMVQVAERNMRAGTFVPEDRATLADAGARANLTLLIDALREYDPPTEADARMVARMLHAVAYVYSEKRPAALDDLFNARRKRR